MSSNHSRSVYAISILLAALVLSAQFHYTFSTTNAQPDDKKPKGFLYDYYGGVSLFSQRIHVLATETNPVQVGQLSPLFDWEALRKSETLVATETQFISLLISRGDRPTGGYSINITSIEVVEKQILLTAEFVDPGEGVIVTEAFTNPIALITLGRLSLGEYLVRLHIDPFILVKTKDGRLEKIQLLTFAEVVWKASFTITAIPGPATIPATFTAVVNEGRKFNLSIEIDLADGISKEEAEIIGERVFVAVLGSEVLRRLDYINFQEGKAIIHYTWGYNKDDIAHYLEATVDPNSFTILVRHCR